jgi:hypothetical protein
MAILRHGAVAGAIGFATVALVFMLADPLAGRPLCYTPALLGGVLLDGLATPADVAVAVVPVVVYSAVRLVVFMALGLLAAWFAALAERHRDICFLLMNLYMLVLVHVSGVVLTVGASLQDVLWAGLVGGATAAAALAMAAYLAWVVPSVRRELREREFTES